MNAEMAEQIKAEYRKTIDSIIESTNYDKTDERIRDKLATSISRAINMSKIAGDGSIRQPRQTVLYRFATILKDCNTYEQAEKRCREAFRGRFDCRANRLFAKFNYDWNISFDVPEIETRKEKKAKKEKERLALIEEERIRQEQEQGDIKDQLAEAEEVQAAISEQVEVVTKAKPQPKDVETFEGILQALIEKTEKKFEKRIEELREIIRHHQHLEDNKVVMVTEI